VQSTRRLRNKLLIALVLFTVVLAAAWMPSRSEASGILSPQIWKVLDGSDQATTISAGDPDIGGGIANPSPAMKRARRLLPAGDARIATFADWVRWTSRIWATLHLRNAR
jgi:hypothetical protein